MVLQQIQQDVPARKARKNATTCYFPVDVNNNLLYRRGCLKHKGLALDIQSTEKTMSSKIVHHLTFWQGTTSKWVGSIPPCDLTNDAKCDDTLADIFRVLVSRIDHQARLDYLASEIAAAPVTKWWTKDDENHLRRVLTVWWLAIYAAHYEVAS